MRYPHIIEAVYYNPWLITEHAHASIRTIVESHLGQAEIKREGTGPCGEMVDVPQMVIDEEGIAVIPVAGVLGRGLSSFEKGSGATDFSDVFNDLQNAEAEGVRGVIFDIDSPGGMVNGTPELANQIKAFRDRNESVPVFTFSAGQVCSAAYWVASATGGLFGTQSSEWGSIGVYMPWIDQKKRLEMLGYRVELIKAGRLKGAGYPGVDLTDEQRAHFQSRIDQIYVDFKAQVQTARGGLINDETMQGQTFYAPDAQNKNLIDGIVPGLEAVKALILGA